MMQNSSTQNYNLLAPLRPVEPVPWSWNPRIASPIKGAMEIGGLLSGNGRHNAQHDTHLRHHMQSGYSANHYAVENNGMIDPITQYGMGQQSAMNFSHLKQPEYPRSIPVSTKVSLHNRDLSKADARGTKVRAEPTPKNFVCSDSKCLKAFARRSDLARHGESESPSLENITD